MAKIARHQTFDLLGGEGDQIRLKKWSAGKMFLIVREFWGLLEKTLEGVDLNKLDEVQLIKQVVATFVTSDTMAATVIQRSVDKPVDLKVEDILEWDADDFLLVMTRIIEMNIHEELVKNFQSLLGSFMMKKQKAQEKKTSEKDKVNFQEEAQPVTSSA